jgi:RNA polymerase-binding transcription factor DksA
MRTDDRAGRRREDDLRQILEAQRRDLTDSLQRRMIRLRESGSDVTFARETDEADPWSLDVRLVEITTATLRRIDAAIERLNGGEYGRCRLCHRPIPEGRLRAMPFAVCCQACEAAREREASSLQPSLHDRLWPGGDDVHGSPTL